MAVNKNNINIYQKFIQSALKEVEKFEKNLQTREDTAWKIVNLAIDLGLFDLIGEDKVPQNIQTIINLACDLEVPDNVYHVDVKKDMETLISLIKNTKI
jgi:tRNA(Ser,Leu) C12 N-acetylase TAN1